MAVTIQPCNAAGEVITRSDLTYAVYPGGLDVNAETTPHIKITNDGSSAETVIFVAKVKDSFRSNALPYDHIQKLFSVPANTSKVFAYQVTFENIATFQGYMKSVHTITADMPIVVRCELSQSGASTFLLNEDVTYHITGAEFKRWNEQRGLPRFDMDYTRLQRSIYNNQTGVWTDNDEGTHCRAFVKFITPAHFPFLAEVIVNAWERIGASTPTQKITDQRVDYTTSYIDYSYERYSSGGFAGMYNLTGMLKVTYTLRWRSDSSVSWETIDTLTLYMSYIRPTMELNLGGHGVAFGKFPSGLNNLFEVAQDWDVEMPGNVSVGTLDATTLSNDLKTIILNAVYPPGSYIFGQSEQEVAALTNSFPGTWTPGSYHYIIPTSDGYNALLYYAKRTAW